MDDLFDISARVLPVAVVGSGVTDPVDAYTDGLQYYSADANAARIGAHLTGGANLAGRAVRVGRDLTGWQEQRVRTIRQLHHRHIGGPSVLRFDTEWLFSVVKPLAEPLHST